VTVGNLTTMEFDVPAPDLGKIIAAWDDWERGDESPGRVMATMKTAGLPQILRQLADSGWVPTAS
jgi:hypothetical protein